MEYVFANPFNNLYMQQFPQYNSPAFLGMQVQNVNVPTFNPVVSPLGAHNAFVNQAMYGMVPNQGLGVSLVRPVLAPMLYTPWGQQAPIWYPTIPTVAPQSGKRNARKPASRGIKANNAGARPNANKVADPSNANNAAAPPNANNRSAPPNANNRSAPPNANNTAASPNANNATAPRNANNVEKATDRNNVRAPSNANKARAPPNGNYPRMPPYGNYATAPPNRNHARMPSYGNNAGAPPDGNYARMPSYGNNAGALPDGNYAIPSLDGNYAVAPLNGNYARAPPNGNNAKAPLNENYAIAPLNGNYARVPPNGNNAGAPYNAHNAVNNYNYQPGGSGRNNRSINNLYSSEGIEDFKRNPIVFAVKNTVPIPWTAEGDINIVQELIKGTLTVGIFNSSDIFAWSGLFQVKDKACPANMVYICGKKNMEKCLGYFSSINPQKMVEIENVHEIPKISPRNSQFIKHILLEEYRSMFLAFPGDVQQAKSRGGESDLKEYVPLKKFIDILKQYRLYAMCALRDVYGKEKCVMYIFPPCEWSLEIMRGYMTRLRDTAMGENFLLVVLLRKSSIEIEYTLTSWK